jgi:hypothetical protein
MPRAVKRCSRCRQLLPLSEFRPLKQARDGLQYHCRECQREYVRQHYAANTAYYLATARRQNAKRVAEIRRQLRDHKSVPCADCGGRYPYWVMDFDHVAGEKLFNVGEAITMSPRVILSEIAKCEVVCANCHRARTFRRRQLMRP